MDLKFEFLNFGNLISQVGIKTIENNFFVIITKNFSEKAISSQKFNFPILIDFEMRLIVQTLISESKIDSISLGILRYP